MKKSRSPIRNLKRNHISKPPSKPAEPSFIKFRLQLIIDAGAPVLAEIAAHDSRSLRAEIVDQWIEKLTQRYPKYRSTQFSASECYFKTGESLWINLKRLEFVDAPPEITTCTRFQFQVFRYGNGQLPSLKAQNPIDSNIKWYSCRSFHEAISKVQTKVPFDCTLHLVESFEETRVARAVLSTLDFYLAELGKVDDQAVRIIYALEAHETYSQLKPFQVFPKLDFSPHQVSSNASLHDTIVGQARPSTVPLSTAALPQEQLASPAYPNPSTPLDSIIREYLAALSLAQLEMLKENVQHCTRTLQLLNNNFAPQSQFNEMERRQIIDAVLHEVLDYLSNAHSSRRLLETEQSIIDQKHKGAFRNIIGSGYLDYILPGVVPLNAAADEFDVDSDDPADLADVEAKINLSDKELGQLLAQLHDSLFVSAHGSRTYIHTSASLVLENGINTTFLMPKKNFSIGILSTGHTWEFFGLRMQDPPHPPRVFFFGKLTLQVLRYVGGRNRSFIATNRDPHIVSRDEVEILFYALVSFLTLPITSLFQ